MKTRIFGLLMILMGCKGPIQMTDKLYENYSWGKEFRKMEKKGIWALIYQPYSEFRNKPLDNPYIHIEFDGFRRTPNQPLANKTIWMYGGSTMLGAGVPDDFTIPAYLQRLLNKSNKRINVFNRGVASWFSGQEIIDLVEALKSDSHPNTVIFYDGINEAICGVRTNLAGVPGNYWSLSNFYAGNRLFIQEIISRIPILGRFIHPGTNRTAIYLKLPEKRKQELAEQIAKAYLQNIDFAINLSRIYNFKVYFFWQPVLYTNTKPLSEFEQKIIKYQDSSIEDMWRRITIIVKNDRNIIYLNKSFSNMPNTVFMDHCHLLPEGNELVANEISKYIYGTALK